MRLTKYYSNLTGKLSKPSNIQGLGWWSDHGVPLLTVDGATKIIPLTFDATKQFIKSFGMIYDANINTWVLKIVFIYNGQEHSANINVDWND